MSATRYQVLYRYMNEATNTPITNDPKAIYEETLEVYTDDHQLYHEESTEAEKGAAEEAKDNMISYGNSSDCPKTNMLFAYDGTRKITHKEWVPAKAGYVIRDVSSIPVKEITKDGDYTGKYVQIGDTIVAKDNPVTEIYNGNPAQHAIANGKTIQFHTGTPTIIQAGDAIVIFESKAQAANGQFFTEDEIMKAAKEATIAKIDSSIQVTDMVCYKPEQAWAQHGNGTVYRTQINFGVGGVVTPTRQQSIPSSINGSRLIYNCIVESQYLSQADRGVYGTHSVVLHKSMIETMTIPGHMETTNAYPYLIKDTYKRILLTPWFVNSTCGSLEAALTKAKKLVDMIGIENVKLIKLVDIDQFVKVK